MKYIAIYDYISSHLLKWYMFKRDFFYGYKVRRIVSYLPGIKKLNERFIKKSFVFPSKINLETINVCNANCSFCPLRKQMTREKGLMDFDFFKKIVDEIANYKNRIKEIYLNLDGEPLLDPFIVKRIEYIKSKGLKKIILVTNGFLLNENLAKSLIKAGLDFIIFSFEAPPKDQYEKNRPPLKFEVVRDNILRLTELRKEYKSLTPYVILRYVITKENKKYLKDYFKFWAGKVSGFSLMKSHSWNNSVNCSDLVFDCNKNHFPCYEIFTTMTIYWDGVIVPCCMYFNKDKIMGNLSENSIKEIWQNSLFERLREEHLNNNEQNIPYCNMCRTRNTFTNKPIWWKMY